MAVMRNAHWGLVLPLSVMPLPMVLGLGSSVPGARLILWPPLPTALPFASRVAPPADLPHNPCSKCKDCPNYDGPNHLGSLR